MEDFPTVVLVVAVALIDREGRIMMQRRPEGRAHGGLWEFPGGKVERGESLEGALVREIAEELGIAIDIADLRPLTFASDPNQPPTPRVPHVILFYTCRQWLGEPESRDDQQIGWFVAEALSGLKMPPLDYPLADALISSI